MAPLITGSSQSHTSAAVQVSRIRGTPKMVAPVGVNCPLDVGGKATTHTHVAWISQYVVHQPAAGPLSALSQGP